MRKRRSGARKARFNRDPIRSKHQRRRRADQRYLTEREEDEEEQALLMTLFGR